MSIDVAETCNKVEVLENAKGEIVSVKVDGLSIPWMKNYMIERGVDDKNVSIVSLTFVAKIQIKEES